MSATTSAATGRCFGIQRVCQVWERSRSALYARRARAHHHRLGAGPARRGPPPRQSDAAAGGDSDRSRSVPVPRRRPSQGPRPASDPGRDPSRPHAGATRHAGARTALPTPRASGPREDPRREGHHPGAQRDVGDGRRAGIHARRRVGLDLRGSRTLERGVRGGGTCAKSGAASRHSIRLRKGSTVAMARWTPTSPVGWRFGWITVVSTYQTTSSSKSGIGGSTPASALSRNRKRTVWRSGGIARSRSKRSTAESFRTSRPSAPPWPTSWCGTTRPGVSRSLGITRRSRRARSTSYARRHSTNVCPGNRVRYIVEKVYAVRWSWRGSIWRLTRSLGSWLSRRPSPVVICEGSASSQRAAT